MAKLDNLCARGDEFIPVPTGTKVETTSNGTSFAINVACPGCGYTFKKMVTNKAGQGYLHEHRTKASKEAKAAEAAKVAGAVTEPAKEDKGKKNTPVAR